MTPLSTEEIEERTAFLAGEMAAQLEGPLLPILHRIQEEFGYVPEASLPVIGEILNVTRAEVHGVVSFYPDFRRTPGAPHTLRICRAEACQARGSVQLEHDAKEVFGCGFGETSPDGSMNLEQVFCLGLCSVGPAAMLDERPLGMVSRKRLEKIAATASEEVAGA